MNNRAPETYGQGEKGLERLLLTLEGQEGAPAAPGYLGEGDSWATKLPCLVPNDRASSWTAAATLIRGQNKTKQYWERWGETEEDWTSENGEGGRA